MFDSTLSAANGCWQSWWLGSAEQLLPVTPQFTDLPTWSATKQRPPVPLAPPVTGSEPAVPQLLPRHS